MTSLRLALKQSLEESSGGGFSPPSLGSGGDHSGNSVTTHGTHHHHPNAPPSPGAVNHHYHSSHPDVASAAPVLQSHAGHSPHTWKKRGPGRPRKNPQQDGGTAKKRGRPRKHPVSGQDHEGGSSSSENEFSGDCMEDGDEDDHSMEDTDEHQQHSKMLKNNRPHGVIKEYSQTERCEQGGEKQRTSISHSSDPDHAMRKKEVHSAPMRDREHDEKGNSKVKTVPAPDPRTFSWARNIPIKEARHNVDQGMRVKVRFSTRVKRDGKLIRKKRWYGGVVSQVSKAGSKIRIKYDDGTTEVAKFPDKDIVVDDSSNGEHQAGVSIDFFLPPEGMDEDEEDQSLGESGDGPEQHTYYDEKQSAQREPLNPSPNTSESPAEIEEQAPTDELSGPTKPVKAEPAPLGREESSTTSRSEADAHAEGLPDSWLEPSPDPGDLQKPSKRKRGRPPKHRSLQSSQEESPFMPPDVRPESVHQKNEPAHQKSDSPTPDAPAVDPLVDTPVQHLRPTKPMEVKKDDGPRSKIPFLDGPQLPESGAEPAKVPIRLQKGDQEARADAEEKVIDHTPEANEHRQDQDELAPRRIHIQLSGSGKSTEKGLKDPGGEHEEAESRALGRTTPVDVPAIQQPPEFEKTPLSPKTKKAKRKRLVEMSHALRSPKPEPHTCKHLKLQSSGSAFQKSPILGDRGHHDSDEEVAKVLSPRGRPVKNEVARSGRRAAVAKEVGEKMSGKHEEPHPPHLARKKKKRDRRMEVDGEESDHEETQQQAPWVQCDKCKKWRIIPLHSINSLPDRWFCENNVWDPKRANCDAPQQKDKQQLREKKRRKKQRLMEKAAESRDALSVHADTISDGSHDRESSSNSRSQEETADDGPAQKKPRRASPSDNMHNSDTSDDVAKGEKNANKKKLRAHAPESTGVHSDEGPHGELKPRGRGRPRRNPTKESDPPASGPEQKDDEGENLEWVQCEKCDKWRKLPPHISADELPDIWYCAMNTWNPDSASCNSPEDKADGLTDIFSNGIGACKLSYRNLIFGNHGRRLNRPISERTRAAESLFAAVSDDADAPPAVPYANSSAFVSRSKMTHMDESDGLSIFDLMSRSHLWEELRAVGNGENAVLCAFDRLSSETKESMKDLILQTLERRTMSGEDVAKDIKCRDWQNVPLGWAAAKPFCTENSIVMAMCELVKEGVLECVKKYTNGQHSGPFILCYRRAESCSKAVFDRLASVADDDALSPHFIKFAKPWKHDEHEEE